MSIKRTNIKGLYKKRLIKRISILLGILSIPVTILIVVFYTTGGKERYVQKDRAIEIYQHVFVQKKKIKDDDFTQAAKTQLNEIYDAIDNNSQDLPSYNKDTILSFVTKNQETYYQFDDKSDTKGKGKFSKWLSKIIIIFDKNNKVREVQYKNN